jgi:hypothetical protein
MHSPIVAMVWENWRITRLEVVQRLAQGIIVPAAVLLLFGAFGPSANDTARLALSLVALNFAPIWLSVMKLNGGRFLDGYRPGYPFYFLYTRPVRTFVLVGAPMAYLVASAVAMYVVSALVLEAAFGYPFLSLPMVALLVSFHIAQWVAQWGTCNKVIQWLGSIVPGGAFAALAVSRFHEWPTRFDFSIGDYALIGLADVALLGLTIAGVARQRRGDGRAAISGTVGWGGFPDWLADLFRLPCPTTSATQAQLWFDLKSVGPPVLAIGAAVAMVITLLFAASISLAPVRPFAIGTPFVAVPALLLFLAGNAFGIRRKQGRTFASTFEATLPCRTAPLAGVKVLVRVVCLLAALFIVGMSAWASLSLVSGWMREGQRMAIGPGFWELPRFQGVALVGQEAYDALRLRHSLQETFQALAGYQLIALAVVISIGVAVLVALRAAHAALRARYARRLNIASSMLLLHGLVLVLLALAARRGMASASMVAAIFGASKGTIATAIVLATLYVAWRAFAERLLTLRSACVAAVLLCAATGAAWVTVLHAIGVQLAGMPTTDAAWMLSPVLLPLMAAVLAPWSLSRVRHT